MKISVIIPVFNVDTKLKRCLDSLVCQKYADFEVLLINDGSTDDSGLICEHFTQLDNRFITIHKVNEGVSKARNLGLQNASGTYICFVDSDDEVLENYLQNLIDDFHKSKNTSLVFQGVKRFKDGLEVSSTEIKQGIVEVNDYEKMFVDFEISLNGNPVSKLFITKIIKNNNLKFNEDFSYNEDKIFILEYLLLCTGKVVFSSTINYKYYINSGSLTNKLLSPDDYWYPYVYFKNLIKDKFNINYNDENYNVIYTNFKIYLHMFMNAIFVKCRGEESLYIAKMNTEDWIIYKRISEGNSSFGRKVFDYFLFKNDLYVPRLIAKYVIAPHF